MTDQKQVGICRVLLDVSDAPVLGTLVLHHNLGSLHVPTHDLAVASARVQDIASVRVAQCLDCARVLGMDELLVNRNIVSIRVLRSKLPVELVSEKRRQ